MPPARTHCPGSSITPSWFNLIQFNGGLRPTAASVGISGRCPAVDNPDLKVYNETCRKLSTNEHKALGCWNFWPAEIVSLQDTDPLT